MFALRQRRLDLPATPSATHQVGQSHERERLLTTLLSNLQGMVYRGRNDQHWTMEYLSEGCLELTGYRSEEVVLNHRVSYDEITHAADRTMVRQIIGDSLAAKARYELEYRIVRADGRVRWVWERGAGSFDEEGRLLAIEGVIQDITDRRQAEQSLREAERRYRSIFENAIEGIFQSTPTQGYLTVNPALARMYGYDSPGQMIHDLSDIEHQLYVEPGRRADFVRAMEQDGSITNFESRVYKRDGSIIWISENARAVRDDNGRVLFYEGTVEAITERKLHDSAIRYQATHDALTGLPNRVLLHEKLHHAIGEANHSGALIAVAFIDLDQFKFVNDSLGHAVGDELLKTMAQRLQSCMREGDVVARLGGDEFVILLCGDLTEQGVGQIATRILAAVAQPCQVAGRDLSMTCSIGISLSSEGGLEIETLLRNADAAMYRAKELGRNNFQYFSDEMNKRVAGRLDMLTHLQHAIEREEFVLYYEPKYQLATRRIVGVEALIRWRTAEGIIAPGNFIPFAEETGLIIPIGEWVLRSACAQNRAWQRMGLPALPVSVNLSRRQLAHGDLAAQVTALLDHAGLHPQCLELEVTESMVMHDPERSAAMLGRLNALGVQISMDDFGTGYSSLGYLKKFPVQCLKIDQTFLHDVTVNPDSAAIVKAIISLGHNLDLRVLAEGVETVDQYDFLRANGCDEFQGYYLSRPMPAEAFAELLRAQQHADAHAIAAPALS